MPFPLAFLIIIINLVPFLYEKYEKDTQKSITVNEFYYFLKFKFLYDLIPYSHSILSEIVGHGINWNGRIIRIYFCPDCVTGFMTEYHVFILCIIKMKLITLVNVNSLVFYLVHKNFSYLEPYE